MARVNRAIVVHDVDGGRHRTYIHDGNRFFHAAARHMIRDESIRMLHRVGFDVHHARRQPAALYYGEIVVYDFLATRRHNDVYFGRVRFGRFQHLVIEVYFVERIGDVVVRLHLDLHLPLLIAQVRRHLDDLRNNVGGRHGYRRVLKARSRTLNRALDRFSHLLDLGDGMLDDGVLRKRLDCVTFNARLFAFFAELENFHRGRTDIDAHQRRLFSREQYFGESSHDFPLRFRRLERILIMWVNGYTNYRP